MSSLSGKDSRASSYSADGTVTDKPGIAVAGSGLAQDDEGAGVTARPHQCTRDTAA
jgi:hypothetical protein